MRAFAEMHENSYWARRRAPSRYISVGGQEQCELCHVPVCWSVERALKLSSAHALPLRGAGIQEASVSTGPRCYSKLKKV